MLGTYEIDDSFKGKAGLCLIFLHNLIQSSFSSILGWRLDETLAKLCYALRVEQLVQYPPKMDETRGLPTETHKLQGPVLAA